MMIMASRSERKGLLWPLSNPLDAIAALLIVANMVGNLLQNASFAGAALIGIISLVFVVRGGTTTWFRGLLEVAVGVILFGYLVQIAGEVFGGWVTNTVTLSLLLALVVTVSVSRSRPNLATNRLLTVFGAIASLGCLAWLLLLRLSTSTVVNFLGYGYDNAAHLAQVRLIIGNRGTSLLSGGLETWPTFIQDSAQAGSSTVATLTRLMGNVGADIRHVLVVFCFVSISLPLLAVVAPLICFRRLRTKWFLHIALAFVVAAVFTTGYLSRIWFSGYFASNLGTLLLILVALAVTAPNRLGMTGPLLTVFLAAHIYPLFLVLGGVLLAPSVWVSVRQMKRRRPEVRSRISKVMMVLVGGLFLLLILPARATNRSFGGSHFFTDGGIEYLPVTFLAVWGTLFVCLPVLALGRSSKEMSFATPVLLSVLLAIGIGVYSLLEVKSITYYPTKLIIGIVLACIAVVVAKAGDSNRSRMMWINTCLTVTAALSYIMFQPEARVFGSAYMGEAPSAVLAAAQGDTEVVRATEILNLVAISTEQGKPILYMSKTSESELNSRWLNTLSGQWNDSSWSSWMSLRDSIRSVPWNEYSKRLAGSSLILATDDEEIFQELRKLNPSQVCLISAEGGCEFG